MLERPEEARTRRRHKTESVKQHQSQDRATATAELEQAQRQAQPAGEAAGLLFPSICCTSLHSLTSCWLYVCLSPLDHIPFPSSFSLTQPVRGPGFHTQSLSRYCWSAAGSTAVSPCQRSLLCIVGPCAAPDTSVATDRRTWLKGCNSPKRGFPSLCSGDFCAFIVVDSCGVTVLLFPGAEHASWKKGM